MEVEKLCISMLFNLLFGLNIFQSIELHEEHKNEGKKP
jgi:hypothetical protein